MNENKYKILNETNEQISLPIMINKIKNKSSLDKNIHYGVEPFLEQLFKEKFNSNIDLSKIKIDQHYSFLSEAFKNCDSSVENIETIDVYELLNSNNHIFTDYSVEQDMEGIYNCTGKNLLYAVDQVKDTENSSFGDKLITPRYKSNITVYDFGNFKFFEVEAGYENIPFVSGICIFAKELKDYKVKLDHSKIIKLDSKYLEMLHEVLKKLTEVNDTLAIVSLHLSYEGKITVTFKNNDKLFNYSLTVNSIEELHNVLKNTEQNTFINFLINNNIYLSYEEGFLSSSIVGNNKKVLTPNNLHVSGVEPKEINDIMININTKLSLLDSAALKVKLFMLSSIDLEQYYRKSNSSEKIKIFIACFNKSNKDHSSLMLDDDEVARLFGTKKNNLRQTYLKNKPEQYELLRLGATCKYYGISEQDLLDLVEHNNLEKKN